MASDGPAPPPQAFGAFVDIGAERSGLVHVSQLSTAFVRSPSDVLEVGQEIECRVVSVDAERGRFSLSLLREGEKEAALERRRSERL